MNCRNTIKVQPMVCSMKEYKIISLDLSSCVVSRVSWEVPCVAIYTGRLSLNQTIQVTLMKSHSFWLKKCNHWFLGDILKSNFVCSVRMKYIKGNDYLPMTEISNEILFQPLADKSNKISADQS